jgi:hypothetical protein
VWNCESQWGNPGRERARQGIPKLSLSLFLTNSWITCVHNRCKEAQLKKCLKSFMKNQFVDVRC